MVPGAAGLAAGLAGATGAAEKVDLRPVLARVVVNLPDGTKAWAERREGQSAWEAADVFMEGLRDRRGEVAHVRAKLAGLLGAEDWEDVVASVVVKMPDGTTAWAEWWEGQTAWEAAEAFIEGSGSRFGGLGPSRESLTRHLEASDFRVAMVKVEMPDGTTRTAVMRAGEKPWEAAGLFLEKHLGPGSRELSEDQMELAERLEMERFGPRSSGEAWVYCDDQLDHAVLDVLTSDEAQPTQVAAESQPPALRCLAAGATRVRLAPGSWISLHENETGDGRSWERRCPACAPKCDYAMGGAAKWVATGVGSYWLGASVPCPNAALYDENVLVPPRVVEGDLTDGTFILSSGARVAHVHQCAGATFDMFVHDPTMDFVSRRLFMLGGWECLILEEIAAIMAADTTDRGIFMDIGSNVGGLSLTLAVLGHDVVAFEAMSYNIELQRASIGTFLDEDARERLHLFQAAVSNDDDGAMTCIAALRAQPGNGRITTACGPESERVRLRTVDGIMAAHGIGDACVTVLKADVEGYEISAFRGAIGIFTGVCPPCAVFYENYGLHAAMATGDQNAASDFLADHGYACESLGGADWKCLVTAPEHRARCGLGPV